MVTELIEFITVEIQLIRSQSMLKKNVNVQQLKIIRFAKNIIAAITSVSQHNSFSNIDPLKFKYI